MFMSVIDQDTIEAYRTTDYFVFGEALLTLRVGMACPELVSLHEKRGVACSAFLTGCNPFSTPLDGSTNAERQSLLACELQSRGLAFTDGIGQHAGNGWPGEPSFLVFGISLAEASAIGIQFKQNAILWIGSDGVPQLVVLR